MWGEREVPGWPWGDAGGPQAQQLGLRSEETEALAGQDVTRGGSLTRPFGRILVRFVLSSLLLPPTPARAPAGWGLVEPKRPFCWDLVLRATPQAPLTDSSSLRTLFGLWGQAAAVLPPAGKTAG